ncbi:DUF2235 domain-containing protein [Erwinia rhapontici]|uniref:T6SS phospholipase effector Tle1-like catalytic domain-containing protein n=1 Tax=Erwinia rhapontici TaxID=55212 RepID=UPI001D0DAC0C|nr:DUF2235 domain-containing protein [Erwinia rhapontici]UDQ79066.1 DUF2235 domain-containing protein [Erwinia rhapontici]
MSEIITDLAWYPPQFPDQGRLPSQAALVGANCRKQDSEEQKYHDELCVAANRLVAPPCCKTLHISLFFDGTGNNLNHDLYVAKPMHPTNIARLFQATIGQGYAGGLGSKNQELTDMPDSAGNKYYKYYIPGVGTPFPEVSDLDFSMLGLATASSGEERINWGLLRIIDALRRTCGLDRLDDAACWQSVQAMGTSMASFGLTGSSNRYEAFQRLLQEPALAKVLRTALNPAGPGQVRLLGIKLYVYGFSRGAAAARAFVNWLSGLLPKPEGEEKKPAQCLAAGGLKIPLSVEFLGLLDTVASVGVPHIAPVAEGHMGWADGTQELPAEKVYGGLIKRCVHLVSSHEQRLCFPLDSIRRTDGRYPANSEEVLYPGMHSDLGGGYPPGDQGKANGPDDGLLLSQIALHETYAAAFSAGAPLKVSKDALPDSLKKDIWRQLNPELQSEFIIDPLLVQRFNAWRSLTLNLPPSTEIISAEQAVLYTPVRASVSLEKALDEQIAWITAWRIGRYAGGSYKTQRFYVDSAANGLDKHSDPVLRKADEDKRRAEQKAVDDERKKMRDGMKKDEFTLLPQGPKDFDAALGQTQLREAAEEFRQDYQGIAREGDGEWYYEAIAGLQNTLYLLNTDNEYGEWLKMKTAGDSHLKVLFPDGGEATNAEQPAGLVRALFDDQVHDSRAWFMYNAFGAREPWGGYFRYRMVYFGEKSNKPLSPLMIAGAVVGAATLVGGVAFIIKQKRVTDKLLGAAGMFGALSLETQAVDILSGKPVSMLPGAGLLKAFTTEPGEVVAQQKVAIAAQRLELAKSAIQSAWREKAQSVITA